VVNAVKTSPSSSTKSLIKHNPRTIFLQPFSTMQLTQLIDREVVGRGVSCVVFDSRQSVPGCLFVAVKGTQVDGHDYIQKAISLGATTVVCERVLGEDAGAEEVLKSNETLPTGEGLLGKTLPRFMGKVWRLELENQLKTIGTSPSTRVMPFWSWLSFCVKTLPRPKKRCGRNFERTVRDTTSTGKSLWGGQSLILSA